MKNFLLNSAVSEFGDGFASSRTAFVSVSKYFTRPGVAIMIDDRKSLPSTEAESGFPLPARFDESARANAQPVQPLPQRGVSVWIQRARFARQVLKRRTKGLALVSVGGLAIGSLGGTMLVKERHPSTDAASVIEEPNAKTSAVQETELNDGTGDAQMSVLALPSAGKTTSRLRKRHSRPLAPRGQRTYRPTVIR